jgi:hypothetical protein
MWGMSSSLFREKIKLLLRKKIKIHFKGSAAGCGLSDLRALFVIQIPLPAQILLSRWDGWGCGE